MLHIFVFARKATRDSLRTFQSCLDLVLVLGEMACEDICVLSGTCQLNSFLCFNDEMILVSTPSAGLSFVGWHIKAELHSLPFGVCSRSSSVTMFPPGLFVNAS